MKRASRVAQVASSIIFSLTLLQLSLPKCEKCSVKHFAVLHILCMALYFQMWSFSFPWIRIGYEIPSPSVLIAQVMAETIWFMGAQHTGSGLGRSYWKVWIFFGFWHWLLTNPFSESLLCDLTCLSSHVYLLQSSRLGQGMVDCFITTNFLFKRLPFQLQPWLLLLVVLVFS